MQRLFGHHIFSIPSFKRDINSHNYDYTDLRHIEIMRENIGRETIPLSHTLIYNHLQQQIKHSNSTSTVVNLVYISHSSSIVRYSIESEWANNCPLGSLSIKNV